MECDNFNHYFSSKNDCKADVELGQAVKDALVEDRVLVHAQANGVQDDHQHDGAVEERVGDQGQELNGQLVLVILRLWVILVVFLLEEALNERLFFF